MKRAIILLIVVSLLMYILPSCKQSDYYVYQDSLLFENDYIANKHIGLSPNGIIDEFSVIYDNQDNTKSFYLFSAPIAYYTSEGKLRIADNSIIETTNKSALQSGYVYQNKSNEVQIYFPKELSATKAIKIVNKDSFMQLSPKNLPTEHAITACKKSETTIYSIKQDMVIYQEVWPGIDLMFYCNTLGLKCDLIVKNKEADISNIEFEIDTSNLKLGTTTCEYNLLKNVENEPKAIFFNPLIKDNTNSIISTKKICSFTPINSTNYIYTVNLSETIDSQTAYPITANLSFYLYKTKQPDSSVKSKVMGNQYLSNYLFTGNSSEMGDMNSYVRFESNSFRDIDYTKIISAKYITYDLTESNTNTAISAYRVTGNWGSPSITWNEQPIIDTSVEFKPVVDGNQFTFDITPLVIEWIKFLNGVGQEQYNNRFGFVLKNNAEAPTDKYSIFSSADNVTCCPRLVINYAP